MQLGAKSRQYVPKNEIYVMNEEGQRISQLTHTKRRTRSRRASVPIAWSANGTRLLTEFGGQDQSYAVAVNTVTGAQKRTLTNGRRDRLPGRRRSRPTGKRCSATTGYGFGGTSETEDRDDPVLGRSPREPLVVGGYEPVLERMIR